jgi:energy-coupling factor transport system permease protein
MVIVARIQREWLKSLRGMTLLSVIIFASNLFFNISASNWVITYNALISATAITFRFIILVTSFSIFFLTTSPDDLSLALEKSHVPYDICFAFTSAIRFIPVLANEAQTILDAQRSRGLELDKGNLVARVRNYVPVLVPLIIGAIRRSLELADAMEVKAFNAKEKRTSLISLEMGSKDYIVLIASVACLILIIYVRYFVLR